MITEKQGLAILLLSQQPTKRKKSIVRIKQWATNNRKPEEFLAGVLAEVEKLCTENG
jgi:hypothetical protein